MRNFRSQNISRHPGLSPCDGSLERTTANLTQISLKRRRGNYLQQIIPHRIRHLHRYHCFTLGHVFLSLLISSEDFPTCQRHFFGRFHNREKLGAVRAVIEARTDDYLSRT